MVIIKSASHTIFGGLSHKKWCVFHTISGLTLRRGV